MHTVEHDEATSTQAATAEEGPAAGASTQLRDVLPRSRIAEFLRRERPGKTWVLAVLTAFLLVLAAPSAP